MEQAISVSSDALLVSSLHFLSTAEYKGREDSAFQMCLVLCKSEDHLLWIQPGIMALIIVITKFKAKNS